MVTRPPGALPALHDVPVLTPSTSPGPAGASEREYGNGSRHGFAMPERERERELELNEDRVSREGERHGHGHGHGYGATSASASANASADEGELEDRIEGLSPRLGRLGIASPPPLPPADQANADVDNGARDGWEAGMGTSASAALAGPSRVTMTQDQGPPSRPGPGPIRSTSGGVKYNGNGNDDAHGLGPEVNTHGTELRGMWYRRYRTEAEDVRDVVRLVEAELSEAYFLIEWPHLAYLVYPSETNPRAVGVVVCKQEAPYGRRNRGYIAMLSVEPGWRRRGIAKTLVRIVIGEMARRGAKEVVIETEADNATALALYGSLGFVQDRRLQGFYQNGKDALRLVRPLHPTSAAPGPPGSKGTNGDPLATFNGPLSANSPFEPGAQAENPAEAETEDDWDETASEASFARWEVASGPEWLDQLQEDEALLRGLGGEMGEPLPRPEGAEGMLAQMYRKRAEESVRDGSGTGTGTGDGGRMDAGEGWDGEGERPGTPMPMSMSTNMGTGTGTGMGTGKVGNGPGVGREKDRERWEGMYI